MYCKIKINQKKRRKEWKILRLLHLAWTAFCLIQSMAVFTNDLTRALHVIREIRAGITWINCYNPAFSEGPWGGYKMSGIGRDLGVHELEEFQEVKQININLSPGGPGWYKN